jgi:hypothetical protein
VDASGQLVDGTQVDGPVRLREALVTYSEQFLRTVTEKLLTYAVGRGMTAADMPAVRAIVRNSAKDQHRFSAIVTGIVTSVPFQMKSASTAAALAETRP